MEGNLIVTTIIMDTTTTHAHPPGFCGFFDSALESLTKVRRCRVLTILRMERSLAYGGTAVPLRPVFMQF